MPLVGACNECITGIYVGLTVRNNPICMRNSSLNLDTEYQRYIVMIIVIRIRNM